MDLSSFQTKDGWFTIAPFDHRGSLAKALNLDLSMSMDREKFLHLKRLFMQIFSPHVSAVLTDPDFGIETLNLKHPTCGLFLSLEESGYSSEKDSMTILKSNWGVEGIKRYGSGAKLLVYYNPKSSLATEKLNLVRDIAADCRKHSVVFLVEPVIHSLDSTVQWEKEGDEKWIEIHLQVCEQFAPHCDILKIQYPGSSKACEQVSDIHPNWILLSRGAPYEIFTGFLTIAARKGCKGYAAGRAIWQELAQTPVSDWELFLQKTALPRIEALSQLLRSSHLVA